MQHIVLLSKDATLPEYFGPYGAKYFKTPNIDKLAANGTVFKKHYTAAPSTAMAFAAMFTGKFSYQMEYTHYVEVNEYSGETLFDKLHDKGFECHLMWSNNYVRMAEKYTKCYGKYTIHHDQLIFNQSCGFNAQLSKKYRERDEDLTQRTLKKILDEVDTIDYNNKNIFLWIHMPHCIKGRRAYGDDIDVFDNLVGEMVKRFGDENMFVTADHGHMNGMRGLSGYGFDVYDRAARIPLIAPKINGVGEIDFPTSNVQLSEIILNHSVEKLPYLICDCAYYAQPKRKTAIIKDNLYYIYTKRTHKEELYDLDLDPSQQIDLAKSYKWKDKDRLCLTDIRQVIQYPYWDEVPQYLEDMRIIRNKIWRNASFLLESKLTILFYRRKFLSFCKGILKMLKTNE